MRKKYLPLSFSLLFLAGVSGARGDERSVCEEGMAAHKVGDFEKAISGYSQCLSDTSLLPEDQAIAHFNRANAYARDGQTQKAIDDYTAVIKVAPRNAHAHYARGVLYQSEGLFDWAIQDYTAALKHRIDFVEAYSARGSAFAEKGEKTFALRDLNKAIDLGPLDPNSYNNRGYLRLQLGDYDKAIEDFNKAIRLRGNFALAFRNRGHAHFFEGRFDDAAKDFQRSFQNDEKDPYSAIWSYLSDARAQNEGRQEELKSYAKLNDLDSWPGPVISMLLGKTDPQVVAEMGRDNHTHLEKVRRAEALFYVGEQQVLAGNTDNALKFFEAVKETGLTGLMEALAADVELKRL
jgi:lipoprotein NlpI